VLNISQFYARPGTPAAKMKRVESATVKTRSRQLTKVFEATGGHLTRLQGREVTVWINTEVANKPGDGRGERTVGHTKSYVKVLVPLDARLVGCVARVRVESTHRWHVEGTVLDFRPINRQTSAPANSSLSTHSAAASAATSGVCPGTCGGEGSGECSGECPGECRTCQSVPWRASSPVPDGSCGGDSSCGGDGSCASCDCGAAAVAPCPKAEHCGQSEVLRDEQGEYVLVAAGDWLKTPAIALVAAAALAAAWALTWASGGGDEGGAEQAGGKAEL